MQLQTKTYLTLDKVTKKTHDKDIQRFVWIPAFKGQSFAKFKEKQNENNTHTHRQKFLSTSTEAILTHIFRTLSFDAN